MKLLITGGAGYIGSHTVKYLTEVGIESVVFDNLEYGHPEAVSCEIIKGDLRNFDDINSVFKNRNFDGVIHFAAYAQAGESMTDPAKYFHNNLAGGVNLLESMKVNGVKNIVFSSTCAIYGFPEKLPVTEDTPQKPVSVYGESKKMFESGLRWYDQLFGIKNVCLRYFNACGAALDGSVGEDHEPETHIIPLAIKTALGMRDSFSIYGEDYNTPDGTCIRDYIHVLDLASAHKAAMEYLLKENTSNQFNVGSGKGYSNKEIIEMVKKISEVDFKVGIGPRRDGDPDAIYADNSKVKKVLNWETKHSDLETIIKSSFAWHKNFPQGYKK